MFLIFIIFNMTLLFIFVNDFNVVIEIYIYYNFFCVFNKKNIKNAVKCTLILRKANKSKTWVFVKF